MIAARNDMAVNLGAGTSGNCIAACQAYLPYAKFVANELACASPKGFSHTRIVRAASARPGSPARRSAAHPSLSLPAHVCAHPRGRAQENTPPKYSQRHVHNITFRTYSGHHVQNSTIQNNTLRTTLFKITRSERRCSRFACCLSIPDICTSTPTTVPHLSALSTHIPRNARGLPARTPSRHSL